ncbi:MAG: glycosyltransferase family 2 protein [Chloroflexota bacterium]
MTPTQSTQSTQQTQRTQGTRPKVIAAIPCFNTRESIAGIVAGAKKHVDEVIVIDDGSHDGTAEAAEAAGAVVANHITNRGYGHAIRSCIRAARDNGADILITLDGDGQHNPDEIPQLLEPILNGEADLVIGSRFLAQSRVESRESTVNSHQPSAMSHQRSAVISQPSDSTDPTVSTIPIESTDSRLPTPDYRPSTIPKYRGFGIRVITWLWNLGSKVKVSDAQSGFRAYNRNILENLSLSEDGMSVSIESLEMARRQGVTIKETPITCAYTPKGLHWKAIRHGLGVALSVMKIRAKNILRF